MLKNKRELEELLEKACENIALNSEVSKKVRDYIYDRYNIPTGTTMDMITQRVSLKEKTEFELFALIDGIDFATNKNRKKDFFTEIELKEYSKTKMEIDKIDFPIKIKCEQVTNDQWIGVANTEFFMKLRREQLIRYNTNAQRVMKRIIKGESVLFKIIPNKLAIKAIKLLMRESQYIPTAITLNIPYDSDAEFYYDEKERELVIKKLDAFDISDGYHRYLAMCEESDANSSFNYPMEIRIINFTDEKTRQFIFQEDQKTKMTHADSKTMNINRPSNNVVDRLNEMSGFDFKGLIGRNNGLISYTELSDIIEYFYFKEKRSYTNIDIRNAANDIKIKLNSLANYDDKYLSKPLKYKELVVIFRIFDIEKDLEVACSTIDKIIKANKVDQIKQTYIGKAMLNAIDKMF